MNDRFSHLQERKLDSEFKAQYPYHDKTILIQIPAYKDKDLLNTVYSALQQANFPERVHFAICYQSDDMRMYHQLLAIPNMKIKYVRLQDARGACYARWCCQQLIDWSNPEDFTFHTDAHMRFTKGWDDDMIADYMTFYEKDKMAILSSYPPSSNNVLDKKFDEPCFDKPGGATCMRTFGFHNIKEHFVRLQAENLSDTDPRVGARNIFVSGGYYFADINVDKHVLYDRHMIQLGDELPYAVRLFTHGYNVYMPAKMYAYHEYTRPDRQFPGIPDDVKIEEEMRVATLFDILPDDKKVDMQEFGLGTKRTLQDFVDFSGLNFKDHTVQVRTNRGFYGDNFKKGSDKIFEHSKYESFLYKNVPMKKINIVCLDLFDKQYDKIGFDKSCMSKADNPERVNIIHVKTESDELYGHVLSHAMSMLKNISNDEFVMFTGNDARFVKSWDTKLVTSMYQSSSKTVLSNISVTIDPNKHKINKLPLFDNFAPQLCNCDLPYFEVTRGNMIMSQKIPTQHMLLGSNFMFGFYKTFKDIPFDPNLSYKEHIILYSLRLFTHGYDIYYPVHCHVMNYEDNAVYTNRDKTLSNNRKLCGYLLADTIFDVDVHMVDYKYGCGRERYAAQFARNLHIDFVKRHVVLQDV